jgi:hypothetical protein
MPFDTLTITTAIGLVNALFRIFRGITKWLKRRSNSIWKEDQRILKILRSYFDRNQIPSMSSSIPPFRRDARRG